MNKRTEDKNKKWQDILDQHCRHNSILFKNWWVEKVTTTDAQDLPEDDNELYDMFLEDESVKKI